MARTQAFKHLYLYYPPILAHNSKTIKAQDEVGFKGRINGYFGKNEMPRIDFIFGINNGAIHDSKHSLGLESVNLSGEYSNGKNHDAEKNFLHVNHFTGKTKRTASRPKIFNG